MVYNQFLLKGAGYKLSYLQTYAQELRNQGKVLIDLTIGDPEEISYLPVRDTVVNALNQRNYSQYPKTFGLPSYLKAVSDWAKRNYNADIDPSNEVISCNGTKEAIFSFPLLFDWSSAKEIWAASLSYPVYYSSASSFNISFRYLPVDLKSKFLPNLNLITEDDWKKCGLFWLNSPHNPTTAIVDNDYIQELLDRAKYYDFFVCSDECYNDLYYTDDEPPSLLSWQDSQRWIVFRSLSKRSHITGFRSGAIISKNKELMTYLKKMRGPMGVGTPTFIQEGAIKAWEDDCHPEQYRKQYKKKRDKLIKSLSEAGYDIFGGNAGFYLWFSRSDSPSSSILSEHLLEKGLLVTPGTVFGEDGEGYVRLAYCKPDNVIDEVIACLNQ